MSKRNKKLLTVIILLVILIQGAIVSYSMINNTQNEETAEYSEADAVDINNIEISQEILNIIKQSDETNYDKNITNYKNLLVKLNVQKRFKDEIERLIKKGYKLPDILIAYEFLCENFGELQELEVLSKERQSGRNWTEIFKTYNESNGEFVPSAFDPDLLEGLMKEPNITSDDIMIADIISTKLEKTFKEIIVERLDGISWKEINGKLGILSSKKQLPRTQVTNEQIEKYIGLTSLTENQIVEGFVIAKKLGKSEKEIIDKIKAGYSKERIYAECYQQIYY